MAFDCPHCGKTLNDQAHNCPSCGADDENGWDYHQNFESEGPEDYDYDEFIAKEFGSDDTPKSPKQIVVVVVCILLLIVMLLTAIR